MKLRILTTFSLVLLLFICVDGQTIRGKTIPSKAKTALLDVMEDADVSSLTITRTASTVEDQVRIMFENIKRTGTAAQYKEYSSYGDAVIKNYEQGKSQGKSDSEIKKMMITELKKQLPAARRNNKLNHVSGSNMIVFDISMSSVKGNSWDEFAEYLEDSEYFHRILVEQKNGCIHVEMKK